MADNIAKGFATQRLLYWAPVVGGSGMTYDAPVEFKGMYIGNAQMGDGSPSGVVFAGGGNRDNMVLFYMCKPAVDGYVCWTKRLAELEAEGKSHMPPDELPDTHKIRSVTEFVMPGTRVVTLASQAFIAGAM